MRERTQFWNTRWANQTGEKTLRYAIVGGTGMIGSWLAGHLRARGDHVWILTRQSPRGEDEIQWHPSRGIQSVGRLEGLDAVFNLSGAHIADRPWTSNRRQLLMESRVGATAVLLESFAKLDEPPKAYVGVSHIGLFGDKGDVFIEDDDPPGGGFLSDLCVAWEAAHLAAEDLGARSSVLRMCTVLSPTGGSFPLLLKPFKYVGGWLGNGQQYLSWISIRDCTAALVYLADNPDATGCYNGTVPEPVRNKIWCQALGRVMDVPVVTHAPMWALRGALGELADGIYLASVRAVPKRLTDEGFTFQDPDIDLTFRWLVDEMTRRGLDI